MEGSAASTSQGPPKQTYEELEAASNAFAKDVCAFPTTDNLMTSVVAASADPAATRAAVAAFAAGTRPLVHADVLTLMDHFLAFKREHGSVMEQSLYADMTVKDLITRLLCKRPLMFMGGSDSFILRTGRRGHGDFDLIGTEVEPLHLPLSDYITYDEMALSAMLSVSVPTHFINSGSRSNCGRRDRSGKHEASGVYVAQVGCRFERQCAMEWRHMVVDANCTRENGYGVDALQETNDARLLAVWAPFYGLPYFPTLLEAQSGPASAYMPLWGGRFLNLAAYRHRMRMVIEPFILDANQRAADSGRKAYLHCVGLGLGVWMLSENQGQVLVDVVGTALQRLAPTHVADVDFSWFPPACNTCVGVPHGQVLSVGTCSKVTIHFSKRNPADRLTGDDVGKLVVANYAWDSNSFPGNEYWAGALAASGDPAAACCSMIPELQNPYINNRVRGGAHVLIVPSGHVETD